jgi:hypothetical protein
MKLSDESKARIDEMLGELNEAESAYAKECLGGMKAEAEEDMMEEEDTIPLDVEEMFAKPKGKKQKPVAKVEVEVEKSDDEDEGMGY